MGIEWGYGQGDALVLGRVLGDGRLGEE